MALATSLPAHAKDFHSSDVNPPGSPTVAAMERLSKLLSARTQGHHRIVTLDSSDRDSENFTIGQVQTGQLDMARVNVGGFNSTVPSTVPLSLPFLFKSTAHLRRVLDGPIGEEILTSLEERGIIALCFYDTGPRSLYSVNAPIRTVADMKDLKIRVQPGDLGPIVVRALGAVPVPMPYSHIGEALKSHAIDAADSNWPAYVADGHYRYARTYNETRHSYAPGVVIVSRAAWQELSAEDRGILKQAARESVSFMRQKFEEREEQSRARAAQEGVRVIEDVDRQAFADTLVQIYPRLLTTTRQRNIVDRIQAEQQAALP